MSGEKRHKVTFDFPTREHAEDFLGWLSNSGEQQYWSVIDDPRPWALLAAQSIDYDWQGPNECRVVRFEVMEDFADRVAAYLAAPTPESEGE